MSKTILERDYDFYYKLDEAQRLGLVGKVFCEKGRDNLYFPIQLSRCQVEHNYGKRQGVIFISPIHRTATGEKWFRVGVFSPDDLDLDLDFEHKDCHLRQEVIEFVKRMGKTNVTYKGVLLGIQAHFGAGEIT